jgi:hypothetical protein
MRSLSLLPYDNDLGALVRSASDSQIGAYGAGALTDDAQAAVAWPDAGGLETTTIISQA